MECPTCHLYFLGIHTRLKYTTRKCCITNRCSISTILYLYFVYNKAIKNVFIFLFLGLFHEVCYNTIVFLKTLKPTVGPKKKLQFYNSSSFLTTSRSDVLSRDKFGKYYAHRNPRLLNVRYFVLSRFRLIKCNGKKVI